MRRVLKMVFRLLLIIVVLLIALYCLLDILYEVPITIHRTIAYDSALYNSEHEIAESFVKKEGCEYVYLGESGHYFMYNIDKLPEWFYELWMQFPDTDLLIEVCSEECKVKLTYFIGTSPILDGCMEKYIGEHL